MTDDVAIRGGGHRRPHAARRERPADRRPGRDRRDRGPAPGGRRRARASAPGSRSPAGSARPTARRACAATDRRAARHRRRPGAARGPRRADHGRTPGGWSGSTAASRNVASSATGGGPRSPSVRSGSWSSASRAPDPGARRLVEGAHGRRSPASSGRPIRTRRTSGHAPAAVRGDVRVQGRRAREAPAGRGRWPAGGGRPRPAAHGGASIGDQPGDRGAGGVADADLVDLAALVGADGPRRRAGRRPDRPTASRSTTARPSAPSCWPERPPSCVPLIEPGDAINVIGRVERRRRRRRRVVVVVDDPAAIVARQRTSAAAASTDRRRASAAVARRRARPPSRVAGFGDPTRPALPGAGAGLASLLSSAVASVAVTRLRRRHARRSWPIGSRRPAGGLARSGPPRGGPCVAPTAPSRRASPAGPSVG